VTYAFETHPFLGAFAKLQNCKKKKKWLRHVWLPACLSVSLSVSVCPSVRPFVRVEQLCFQWKEFYEIVYWSIVRKFVERIKNSLKSDKNKGYITR